MSFHETRISQKNEKMGTARPHEMSMNVDAISEFLEICEIRVVFPFDLT